MIPVLTIGRRQLSGIPFVCQRSVTYSGKTETSQDLS